MTLAGSAAKIAGAHVMTAPVRSSRMEGFVSFGVFEFDPETGDLWKSGRHIRLPDQPRQVLRMLVSRPGELVTREELRRALWPDDTFVDFETGLNVIINRIRQVLDDSASTPRFIETLARRGYRFIAPIAAPNPAASSSGMSTLDATADVVGRHRWGIRYGTAVTVLLVAIFVVIAGAVEWRRAGAGVPVIRSIAVLPLRDVSPDPKEAWFAEGMTDAVIADLSRISALRVISRQSTIGFQDSLESMDAISRRVGADALIEGSTGLVDGRVRLAVRLVHGATDRQLWSQTYQRPLSDVLALQGELAEAVADAVRVAITGDEQKALAARRSVDPEAYSLYMRAGHFFNLRSPEAVKKSIEYYEQAIASDRSFAAAYGGMALSYCLRVESLPADEVYRHVKQAAAQALAIDPSQVDALVAMTQATFYGDRNWRDAKRNLESILHRYPSHATAHAWYGSILTEIGPLDEALAERRLSLRLDPLSLAANNSLGVVLTQMGRYPEAVTSLQAAVELEPDYADAHGWLGYAYLKMGRKDEAVAEVEKCAQLSHDQPRMVARLAHVYGLVGRKADGQRLLQSLIDRSQAEYVPPMRFAHAYAGLGDFDRAFARLEEAYQQGGATLMRLKSDPMLDPLKGDPRFADLVRRLNLPWP